MIGLTINISNEGWDAICILGIAIVVCLTTIVYTLKTGKWPWR